MSSNETRKNLMDEDAKVRIQSDADKTGENQGFKARAQSAADQNANANATANQGEDQQKK